MSFRSKTDGFYSFDDAYKQASTAGKWKDRLFKLSGSSIDWDNLWDAAGEKSLIELLLGGRNAPITSRLIWVGKDASCDYALVSEALTAIAGWTGGDIPSITNPVAIMVKPGTYEDSIEISLPYVHVFGIGNQAESVIIQNNAHHIVIVNHPEAGLGFNILKGLELYQYGTDVMSAVLFNAPSDAGVTALLCRECYFRRDISGGTTAASEAVVKINHGLFWAEDVRIEMRNDTPSVGVNTPHMFFFGDGFLAGAMLRDAKIDYGSVDEADTNSLFLMDAAFTGDVNVLTSEINVLASGAESGGIFYVLNQTATNSRFRFEHSVIHMDKDGTGSPDELTVYHLEAGEILSAYNSFEFRGRNPGTVFSGTATAGVTLFDSVVNGILYDGATPMGGLGFDSSCGLLRYLPVGEPSTKNVPWTFMVEWFEPSTADIWARYHSDASDLMFNRKLSYADWTHVPQGLTEVTSYETYRLTVPDDNFVSYVFVPGRPIYSVLEDGVTRCHGIVIAAASSFGNLEVDVAGYLPSEVETHDMQSYRYGDFSRVVTERFVIPGLFAYQADTALLTNYLKQNFIWKKGKARIVQISTIVGTQDSGANQPNVNVAVKTVGGSYHPVGTSNVTMGRAVSTSWVHTVDDIDGPVNGGHNYNQLDFNSEIEIMTDANGSNDDAADLTVIITAVLE